MYSRILFGFVFISILAGNAALAQAPVGGAIALSGGGAKAGMVTMRVEDTDVEPTKGAPFCATVTTEHTQAFADGNRIHTTDNSNVCRDSEGRTRREASLNLLGAAAQNPAPKLVTIVDPVAGYRYMLDSESKTAHRFAIASNAKGVTMNAPLGGLPDKGERAMFYQRVGTVGPNMAVGGNVAFKSIGRGTDDPAPTTENLGDQTIEGIHATGTRMTTTIPAGQMGNEQPIFVTSERWYSSQLKATVMTKHTDPWAGELKTQFANVSASEPDSSLFRIPSDYKVVDEKAGPFVLQKQMLAQPPPPQ